MVTLEQVEKLREYAQITYEEAKAALEETDGDILEAIVNLEKDGKITRPEGGSFSSKNSQQDQGEKRSSESYSKEASKPKGTSFGETVGKFFKWLGDIISKGNRNSLDVMKDQEKVLSIPVTILAILLIFTFWITIPLLVVGLFLGYRYKIIGPELGKDQVNRAMDTVADAAENLKKEVKGEMSERKDTDN